VSVLEEEIRDVMGWDGWIWIGSTGREQRQLRRGEGKGRASVWRLEGIKN
jgi:hypothetical protein